MTRASAEAVKNTRNVTVNDALTLVFFAIFSGLLHGLSFPPFKFSLFPYFFLIPLLLQREIKTPFLWGLLSGFTAHLLIFFWMWDTFRAAGVGFFTTLSVWMALSLMMGSYSGFFLLIYEYLPQNFTRPFVAGALWVSLDFFKSVFLTGFPWALLAHTQVSFPVFIYLASLTGASGVTFFLVAINSALSELLSEWRRQSYLKGLKSHFAFLQYLLIFIAWGGLLIWSHLISKRIYGPEPSLKIALLQGNIGQYQKWDETFEDHIRKTYEELVQVAVKENPDLIVWPEASVPGWIPNDALMLDWLTNLIKKSKKPHLIGAVRRRGEQEFNSAFIFDSEGQVQGVYDKQHLVPFGEYIPFGGILKKLIPYLGQLGTFDAGKAPQQFRVAPCGPLTECFVSPNICYEAIFPGLVRKTVGQETVAIVNLTNDGWYLKTGAPAQHFAVNVFRAIENNLPVIRAANTGISALIDRNGRTVKTKLMEKTVLVGSISAGGTGPTLFQRWGQWFDWTCVLGTMLGMILKYAGSRRHIGI